jgi:hypothetical protein
MAIDLIRNAQNADVDPVEFPTAFPLMMGYAKIPAGGDTIRLCLLWVTIAGRWSARRR